MRSRQSGIQGKIMKFYCCRVILKVVNDQEQHYSELTVRCIIIVGGGLSRLFLIYLIFIVYNLGFEELANKFYLIKCLNSGSFSIRESSLAIIVETSSLICR